VPSLSYCILLREVSIKRALIQLPSWQQTPRVQCYLIKHTKVLSACCVVLCIQRANKDMGAVLYTRIKSPADQHCWSVQKGVPYSQILLLCNITYIYLQKRAMHMSANLYDIHHCCVCSEKLLMMDRGTVRNM